MCLVYLDFFEYYGCGPSVSMYIPYNAKSVYIGILWVKNIYDEMLQLFILYTTILLTSTYVYHMTNFLIKISLPMYLHIYLITCFIWLTPFPKLLHVYLTNQFVQSILQGYFSIYCALCVFTCYGHLVHICYYLGVHI